MRPVLALFLLLAGAARAAPQVYDFSDPKQVNTIAFNLDSVLEPFAGLAYGVAGKVTFDPDQPESLSGAIAVPAGLVLVPNADMLRTLQGEEWLDAANHPEILFTIRKVQKAEKKGPREFLLQVEGELKIRGKAKNLLVPISVTHLPDQVRERGGGREGDLLALRSAFTIRRSDFDIKPAISVKKVAEEVTIRSAIVGYSAGPATPRP
jgi:polyisoprenoid-binding protein YceI